MATPRARTANEARAYLDLAGCRCRRLARAAGRSFAGRARRWAATRYEAEVLTWRRRVVRFTGTCPRCGQPREAVFEVADPPAAPVPRYASGYGDGPSHLLDAGADAVPDEAFWTDDGLALRAALPEWFGRHRLVALRLLQWRAVTDFEDSRNLDEPDEVHHAVAG